MTKNRFTRRLNDLLQVAVIITILMSFAGYEAQRKESPETSESSREFTRSSSPFENSKNHQDSLRVTKSALYSTMFSSY